MKEYLKSCITIFVDYFMLAIRGPSASYSTGSNIGVSGNIGGGGYTGAGGTLVQKHIYVHVAPPEPEELRPQRPISAGQSTKHYKIIFIKAPSYDLQQQQILQAQVCLIFLCFTIYKVSQIQGISNILRSFNTIPLKTVLFII